MISCCRIIDCSAEQDRDVRDLLESADRAIHESLGDLQNVADANQFPDDNDLGTRGEHVQSQPRYARPRELIAQ